MKVTYDSQGRDITCMKEFSALKFPCRECDVKDCDEREEDKWMNKMSKKRAQEIIMATACCSFGTRLLCNNCPWREKRDCDIVIDEELFTEALDTLRNERTVNEMKLSDIKIRECFKATTPSERKMEKCREYWKLTHNQDRYIIVDHNNVLVDGYVMYLVLKENGVEEVEVKVSEKKENVLEERESLIMIMAQQLTSMVSILLLKSLKNLFGVFLNHGKAGRMTCCLAIRF